MVTEDEVNQPGASALVVWRFVDGKPGHESQTCGLVEALKRRIKIDLYTIPALSKFEAFFYGFVGRNASLKDLPAPDLVVGAGHRTHLSMLAAKRIHRSFAVVLMKPSLPANRFDLCLIPRHDKPKAGDNIIETVGVLNAVQIAKAASLEAGLFLVGGPSSHYDWDSGVLCEQVSEIARRDRSIEWVLTTSRRTPKACESDLAALSESNVKVVLSCETPAGWVAEHLQQSKWVWVSEDSVSMVFEALSAGASVGLLPVPPKGGTSRVRASIDYLRENNWVVNYPAVLAESVASDTGVLQEADRCADLVLKRYGWDGA